MSAANEDTDRDAIASCCSHGGEEPMAIADRSHEPVQCRWCGGKGWGWISSFSTVSRPCWVCKGTGLAKDTA